MVCMEDRGQFLASAVHSDHHFLLHVFCTTINKKQWALGPLSEGAVTEGDWGSVISFADPLPPSRLATAHLPQRGRQGFWPTLS